jgi:hypothetical protein
MHIKIPAEFDYLAHVDGYFNNPEMLAEIQRIVDEQIRVLAHKDKLTLIGEDEDGLIKFHHGYGTLLRNHYNLWNAQPGKPKSILTTRWTEDGATHDLQNGIDCSADHPDAVSMMFIKCIYHKCIFDRKP